MYIITIIIIYNLVVCGDDIIPRATPETVSKLKKRLADVSVYDLDTTFY